MFSENLPLFSKFSGSCQSSRLKIEKKFSHFQIGNSAIEAVRLINGTLESDIVAIEAVNMRGVIEAGSIDTALSLGMIRRMDYEDSLEDGDLLLVDPGELDNFSAGEKLAAI